MPTSLCRYTFWSGKGPKISDPNRKEDEGFGVSASPTLLPRSSFAPAFHSSRRLCSGTFRGQDSSMAPSPKAVPSPPFLVFGRDAPKVIPNTPTAGKSPGHGCRTVCLSHGAKERSGQKQKATDTKRSSAGPLHRWTLASLWHQKSISPRSPVLRFQGYGGAIREGGDSSAEPNSYPTSALSSCNPTVILKPRP